MMRWDSQYINTTKKIIKHNELLREGIIIIILYKRTEISEDGTVCACLPKSGHKSLNGRRNISHYRKEKKICKTYDIYL